MPYLAEIMRKKTKRKVWNLIDPLTHAIVGASITQRDKLDQLRLLEYSALDAMTKGSGTIQDWRTLVDVLNLSEMMARGGIGPEVLPVCQKAQDSLHKAALRYEDTKKMGLDGQGIVAIRELIEYADLQQSSISRSEFEKYIQKTKNYIKSHGDKVVEIT
jgi:hypothetical protein